MKVCDLVKMLNLTVFCGEEVPFTINTAETSFKVATASIF